MTDEETISAPIDAHPFPPFLVTIWEALDGLRALVGFTRGGVS